MNEKRGSTLAELVVVMAVVGIMSVMVVSFTIICNSWVTFGVRRYNSVQDSYMFSKVFHEFVEAHDSADCRFVVEEDRLKVLMMVPNNDGEGGEEEAYTTEEAYTMFFDEENKILEITQNGETSYLSLDDVNDISFNVRKYYDVALVDANVKYTYLTPGKVLQESNKEYKVVVALRAAKEKSQNG